ncbi:MAG: T9SS type A sorting domain-containing protein, partial [Flavobacteriaceae bacterium]|nr:T9SS type A sorting domain-containing protein [Flavobacteriaceae bacterium]
GTPIDWNIAVISHDIESGNRDITVLGLLSDTADKYLDIFDPGTPMNETNDGQFLRVTHYLFLDGIIDLYGESQLVQDQNSVLDPTSTGGMERDQQGTTNLYNYNYWSSPVSVPNGSTINNDYSVGAILRDGSDSNNPLNLQWTNSYDADPSTTPITLSRRWIYVYENYPENTYADWRFIGQNGSFAVGLGFTMKGSGVGDPVTDVQNYVFRGLPNNGVISNPINPGYQSVVGNPYPSVIDADQFILDNIPGSGNGSIDGTLYYWEHYISNFTHYLELYEGAYATYNLTGGVGAVIPDGISGAGTSTKTPGQYIPVGQGFFVTASPAGGNVTFNNGQRIFVRESAGTSVFMEANNQEQVFGEENSNTPAASGTAEIVPVDDIQRVRINFNSPNGANRELLLGFVPDNSATDGFDFGYDAPISDLLPNDMAWMIEDEPYVIQGVGNYTENSQYELGIYMEESAKIQVSLNSLENFDENIQVYIYDALMQTSTNLNSDDFDMILDPGEHMERFYITFVKSETLDLEEFEKLNLMMNYLQDSEELFIKVADGNLIESIRMVNLLGQEVAVWDEEELESFTELRLAVDDLPSGPYVVSLNTLNGKVNKKIIIGR